MSRRWLVVVSIAVHLSVMFGLFASGVWQIERVEAGRIRTTIDWRPLPPPAAAPALAGAVNDPIKPKHRVKERRQPEKIPEVAPKPTGGTEPPGPIIGTSTEAPPFAVCTENCGEAPPAAPVCGNLAREASEQCDDGNTLSGDGCSSACRIEEKPRPVKRNVLPSVLQALRISGETQIHPSTVTQNQMIRDGASRVEGNVTLCVAIDGSVSSARMLGSTGYGAYDAALVAAVGGWRYRPYMVDDVATPACSTVRFVYTIR